MATIGSVRKMSNGCPVAERVPRQEGDFREPLPNIAAIDFGTTNCSVAYVTQLDGATSGNLSNPGEGPQRLPLNRTFYRVPTAILFTPDGAVSAFGHDARAEYLNVADGDRSRWAYFEQIKMDLQHEENVHREMKIKAKNNTEYYLVDVITQILRFLKTELIEVHLQRGGHELQATDFDWVITVPAIWKARGKQMMREAGYKAGLCSTSSAGFLKPASGRIPFIPDEVSPDRLSLALEPEAAALYCQSMTQQQLATYCTASEVVSARNYVIADIGGGTVDVIAYQVRMSPEEHIRILHQPAGNDSGGTQINKMFAKFLEILVNDRGFIRYIEKRDEDTSVLNQAYLNELVNDTFEKQKQIFGSKGISSSGQVAIRLPFSFMEEYKLQLAQKIRELNDSSIELKGNELRLKYKKMEEFFKPVVEEALACIEDTLNRIDGEIEILYLVGGFGGSRHIYDKVKARLEARSCRPNVIVPGFPDLAIVLGAVTYRQRPDLIHSRCLDATYGVRVNLPFIDGVHDEEYKFTDSTGKEYCENIFSTFVECGDIVSVNELFMKSYLPTKSSQRRMHIDIYSSPEKDVWYTTGKRSVTSSIPTLANVQKIGELVIPFRGVASQGAEENKHEVEVKFDFSHTEIQVKGFDRNTGTEVKVVLDFLTG